jgi:hypothetical protein
MHLLSSCCRSLRPLLEQNAHTPSGGNPDSSHGQRIYASSSSSFPSMLMTVLSIYWMVQEALELWLVHRPTQKH